MVGPNKRAAGGALKSFRLIAGLLAFVIAGPLGANSPIVIKFSHVVAEDTPKGKAAGYFKRLAEERTHGRVRVEVYPNSQLYKDREELEALQLGAVQMLAPALSKFSPLGLREFEVFDLPYLFDSYEELHKVTQGAIGRALLKKLENRGILGLAYWDNGFKQMSANRPLVKPEDMSGLRVRIQPSSVLDRQMRTLGAIPYAMAFSNAFDALQRGVVDGTENPISNLYTQRMHHVQKHLTLSDHGYLGYAVIVNKKFWENQPSNVRRILEDAMRDATRYANEIARRENERALDAVRSSGTTDIVDLTAEQKLNWKKAMAGTHVQMADNIGRDLIAKIYKETGFNAGDL
jgi:C4-dicarboxylate-binding protein DctP